MAVVVTPVADHQRLALASSHDLHPERLVGASSDVEVLQGANVMHLDVPCRAAELTRLGQEPLFEFRTRTTNPFGRVIEDGVTSVRERDSARRATSGFLPFNV